ncbi:MAG: hypothetical protein GY827_08370 [Cytophagales bacterium]|nr:hypothetical protein [Cytophagales bacterium]
MTLKQQANKINDFIKFFCEEYKQFDSDQVKFMIQHNFIHYKTVNIYTVNQMYLRIKEEYPKKEAALTYISNRYGFKVRWCYYLVKEGCGYFRKNKLFQNNTAIN